MVDYFRRAVRSIGYAALFSLAAMLVSYLFRLVIARNLGPAYFGLFQAVLSFVLFVNLIREPGLRSAVVKFLPQWIPKNEYQKINALLTQTITTWLIGSGILFLLSIPFAGWLSRVFFEHPHADMLLIIMFFVFFINNIDYLLTYIFQGHQRIGLSASVDFVRVSLFLVLSLLGFALYPASVFVPAMAYVITPLVLAAIYIPILRKKVDSKIRLVKQTKSQYLAGVTNAVKFGLPITVTSLLFTGFQQVSILVLTGFRPLAEVGLFSIAITTSTLLINLATSISITLLPLTSELSAKGLERRLESGASLVYKYTFLSVVPLSLMLFVFADLVVVFLFGTEYVGAVTSLRVLSIGTVFWIIASINFSILAGLGKSKEPLRIAILIAAIVALLTFVLVPLCGLLGASFAIVVGYIAAMILSLTSLRKYLKPAVPKSFWTKGFIASVVFVGALAAAKRVFSFSPYVEAGVSLLLAGILYLAILVAQRLVTLNELISYLKMALPTTKNDTK